MSSLKKLRQLLGSMVLLAIILAFIRFDSFGPAAQLLSRAQLIPAIFSLPLILAAASLAVIFVVTLLTGRIYCSIVCPFGLLQDVIIRATRLLSRKRFVALPALGSWHYYLALATFAAAAAGFMAPMAVTEPFAAFGRLMTAFFQPAATALFKFSGPLISDSVNWFSQASHKPSTIQATGWAILFAGLLLFICSKWGRIYCNSICPAGAILRGLTSFSFFQLKISENSCINCGLCEGVCKAGCISVKEKAVDFSRCIGCFNCLDVCRSKAISLCRTTAKATEHDLVPGRRNAMGYLAALAAGYLLPTALLAKKQEATAILPPGAMNHDLFRNKCIACHLCVAACPSSVIRPNELFPGIKSLMQPALYFDHGMCEQNCNLCSQLCPVQAIQPVDPQKKKLLKIGEVVYKKSICVVETNGKDCGACAEHCPTQAVRMVPYHNNLMIPEIHPEICIGCGSCEHICPVRPEKAIVVVPVYEQIFITMPESKPLENTGQLGDFPF